MNTQEPSKVELDFYKSKYDKLREENIELRKELAYWRYLGTPEEIDACLEKILTLLKSGDIDFDSIPDYLRG